MLMFLEEEEEEERFVVANLQGEIGSFWRC